MRETCKNLLIPCKGFAECGRYLQRRNGTTMRTKAEAKKLANLISTHAPYDGEFALRLPGVYAVKVSQPTTAMAHGLQRPAACIIVGGTKKVMIGDDLYEYAA